MVSFSVMQALVAIFSCMKSPDSILKSYQSCFLQVMNESGLHPYTTSAFKDVSLGAFVV